ncbi:type II secretion system F family protein [Paenibacillus methanolicus]|uniref:Tight adherence protein B n=1 Tax=Paenibacillus methanolicus TaxID=582686 RepID=A0A5S5BR73_9BACL|nr:type II secretion system F family protein [Paenibacillus methanolicus]TYP69434.1 tight adherence protein B [Paenibacillus methanolicus]
MAVILTAMVFTTSLMLFIAVLQLLQTDKRMEKRLRHYLVLHDKKPLGRRKFGLLVQLQLSKQAVRERVLTKKKSQRLEERLSRAGITMKPEEYILFQWVGIALGGGLLYLLTGQPALLAVGAVAGFLFPGWMVDRLRRKRLAAFNDSLLDMLTTIIGSLRAGFSFVQALKTVVEESTGPMRDEADIVLKEMQYGASVEDALGNWRERMPSEDLDLLVQAILIQRQIGGNLAVILETIVQTLRDRGRIQRQVTTLTAQGRLSGMVIGLLPLVLGVLLYLIEPDYIGTLFRHPIGMGLLAGGGVSGMIGFVLIRKMTQIEV